MKNIVNPPLTQMPQLGHPTSLDLAKQKTDVLNSADAVDVMETGDFGKLEDGVFKLACDVDGFSVTVLPYKGQHIYTCLKLVDFGVIASDEAGLLDQSQVASTGSGIHFVARRPRRTRLPETTP